jgi:hypothetical protein
LAKTHLDDSRWPLVIFTAIGEQSEDDFEAYLADADALLRRRERYASIFDTRRAAPIGPILRRRQARWLAQNEEQLRAYLVATSLVMTSALHRGILRAIMWLKPLPCPYSIEPSFGAARAFVCAQLAANGCAQPPWFGWNESMERLQLRVGASAAAFLERTRPPADPRDRSTGARTVVASSAPQR